MNFYDSGFPYSDELYHHGIKNQKWGLRRYQNEDGSLTPLGRIHYGVGKVRDAAVESFKRKHPRFMNEDELNEEINRQRKLNELKKAREEGQKGSAGDKAKEVLWKGAQTAVTTLATQTMSKIGQGVGERIVETNQQKRLRELTENENIYKQMQAVRTAMNEASAQIEAERAAERREREAERTRRESEREMRRQQRIANRSRRRYPYIDPSDSIRG